MKPGRPAKRAGGAQGKRSPGAGGGLDIAFLERTARVLRMLAHPHRLKIVEILEAEPGIPVHAVTERLGLSQAATSQHLNQMRRVGLVESVREGKEVRYRLADPRSLSILNCLRRGGRS